MSRFIETIPCRNCGKEIKQIGDKPKTACCSACYKAVSDYKNGKRKKVPFIYRNL